MPPVIGADLRSRAVAALGWVALGRSARSAALQTFLARGLILAINLAAGILATRWLGPEGRGEQAALSIGVFFFAALLSLGLPSALTYTMSRSPEDRPHLLGAALLLSAALGLLATLLGVLVLPLWLTGYPPNVREVAQLLTATCVFSLLVPVCTAALEATGDFTTANLSRFLNPALTLAGLLALAALDALTPLTATLCYVGAGVPVVLWMLTVLWRRCRPRMTAMRRSSGRLMGFGLRAYGIDLLNTFAAQMDLILVVGLLQPAQAGAYFAALSAARVLGVVQMSIVTVLFPKASSKPEADVIEWVGRAARCTAAATLAIAVPMFVLGPSLIRILYGEAFLEAVPLLRILVVEVFVSSLVVVLAQAFMALGRPGWVAVFQGAGLALALPLMVLLVPGHGLLGAGMALLASAATRLALVLAAFRLVLGSPPPSLVLTREDLRLLVGHK